MKFGESSGEVLRTRKEIKGQRFKMSENMAATSEAAQNRQSLGSNGQGKVAKENAIVGSLNLNSGSGSDGTLSSGINVRNRAAPVSNGKGPGMIGGGHAGGNQLMQQAVGSQPQSQGSGVTTRSFKEMVEVVKKLHSMCDDTQERICNVYRGFAEVTLKAAFLFDPLTIQILNDRYAEIGGIPSPEEVHFTRESVNDAYIELSQVLSQRPPADAEFAKDTRF